MGEKYTESVCSNCTENCCSGGVSFWIKDEDIKHFSRGEVVKERPEFGKVKIRYDTCEHLEDGECGIYGETYRPRQCGEYPYGPDTMEPDLPPPGCLMPRKKSEYLIPVAEVG